MDITSLLLSKKYVDDSLAGAGAVKGKSAYEVAVDNGFQGSESDWLASLVGTTPRIGDNGHWFIDDFDTGVIASPSLAGYATEDFVANEIKKIDLTPFITKEDAQKLVDGAKPDLSPYATKDDVNTAVGGIKIPEVDLTPYATKEDVKEAVGGIQIPETDLSNYPTKQEVAEAIGNIEHPQVDLSGYAKTEDIPSTEGLASEKFVTQKIAEAELADKDVDLSSYYTKTETDQKIKEALENIEVSGDGIVVEGSCSCEALTEEEILAIIDAASGGGAVDSQTGQVLTEMTAEDVQTIVKNI